MTYFHKRNEYVVEYSGHEEATQNLRIRLASIIDEVISNIHTNYRSSFWSRVYMEFPSIGRYSDCRSLFLSTDFHTVFAVVEIFLDYQGVLLSRGSMESNVVTKMKHALDLSGSVYTLNKNRFELKIEKDLAEKVDSIKEILKPYPEFNERFYQAVGNLVGRKAKSEDVVKDTFVAVEGYLKAVTNTSRFGEAIKDLSKKNLINKEQVKILEALNTFASDASGARHAGNGDVPTEETTLWFLDTLVAQIRMIDKVIKKIK
jgi:hypothetical protein